jgi:HEAT repeat protein
MKDKPTKSKAPRAAKSQRPDAEPELDEEDVQRDPPANTGDKLLDVVVSLLDHPRGERRSAAAIVLAEYAPKNEVVIERLREAVRRPDDASLRRHAADAIGAIAPKSIVTDLQHLLKDPDRNVRDTASRVLASGKTVKASEIAKMLDGNDEKERLAAIVVLGAMGGREARQRLLSQLAGGSMKVHGAVIDALRPSLTTADGAEAQAAIEDIRAVTDLDVLVTDPDFALAIVQILSNISDEASCSLLMTVAGSQASPEVRASAIEAIKRVVKTKKPDPNVFKFLIEMVEDKTQPAEIHGAAIEALLGFEVPLTLEPRVRGLLTSESASIRRFAIRALGQLDTSPAAKGLAKVVESGDPADREAALEVARLTMNGRAELARLLGRTKEEARARQIAASLRGKGEELEASTRQLLENLVVEVPPETAEIIIELLKGVGGQSASKVQDSLLEKAMKLKKKAQWQDAITIFKSIGHGQSADPEARFQLGVCELKVSKKTIVRGPSNDPCVQTFAALQRVRDFPVLERLKAEKSIEPDEMYYLGFTLAEGNATEQALGGEILSVLAEDEASKLGKMARNKLVSMGWEE